MLGPLFIRKIEIDDKPLFDVVCKNGLFANEILIIILHQVVSIALDICTIYA